MFKTGSVTSVSLIHSQLNQSSRTIQHVYNMTLEQVTCRRKIKEIPENARKHLQSDWICCRSFRNVSKGYFKKQKNSKNSKIFKLWTFQSESSSSTTVTQAEPSALLQHLLAASLKLPVADLVLQPLVLVAVRLGGFHVGVVHLPGQLLQRREAHGQVPQGDGRHQEAAEREKKVGVESRGHWGSCNVELELTSGGRCSTS